MIGGWVDWLLNYLWVNVWGGGGVGVFLWVGLGFGKK